MRNNNIKLNEKFINVRFDSGGVILATLNGCQKEEVTPSQNDERAIATFYQTSTSNPIVKGLVKSLSEQKDAKKDAADLYQQYGEPLWDKAVVVGNGHVQSVLVPMKEPGYNHIATIWGFNIYSENTTYNFMRNDECDPSYAKLGWLFQIMDKQVFNVDPKGMRISKRESHLKTYDYIIEDCYWMDYYKVYGVSYTFIGSREYCPTSGYWVDTNPNPNSGNIPHGSGGTTTPPAKPKPGTEPVVDTTDLKNHPIVDCVFQSLMAGDASTLRNMLANFLGSSTKSVVTWKVEDYKPEDSKEGGKVCNRRYNPNTGQVNVDVVLNESAISGASVLLVAQTILHEAIHAELWAKVCLKEELPAGTPSPYDTFDGLINAYNRLYGNLEGEHVFTADMYVKRMADALEAYHKPFRGRFNDAWNYDGSLDYKTLYTMLSWRGLGGTPQWEANMKEVGFKKIFDDLVGKAKMETTNCPK